MGTLSQIEKETMRLDLPDFAAGDTVKVHVKIKEGEKERIQAFQGVVISKRARNANSTFTVRKVSYGIGVERIFPLHSPFISDIEVITRGQETRPSLREEIFARLLDQEKTQTRYIGYDEQSHKEDAQKWQGSSAEAED